MRRSQAGAASSYLRSMPDNLPDRAAIFSLFADALLADPIDRDELLSLAKVASRVEIQALVQYAHMPATDPRDDDLLTPAEVAREFKVKRYSVEEAIRRKLLKVWRPHPQATRGFKVPRGIARAWAKAMMIAACLPWEVWIFA